MGIKLEKNKTITSANLKLRLMKNKSGHCFLQVFDKKVGLWLDILEITPYGQIRRCDKIPAYIPLDKCIDGLIYIS